MAKPNPKVLFRAATQYLKTHPEELFRALRGALGLRAGVPLDALRYLAEQLLQGEKAPQDLVIDAAPPGLRAGATVRAMGATLRASLVVTVDEINVTAHEARVTVRISELKLDVLDGVDTPVGGLLKSGALDLSKPGNLVAFIPKRPEMLLSAEDDRVELDLLKVPKIAKNRRLKRLLAVLSPVVGVQAIRTRDDHLDVHFELRPSGLPDAMAGARSSS